MSHMHMASGRGISSPAADHPESATTHDDNLRLVQRGFSIVAEAQTCYELAMAN